MSALAFVRHLTQQAPAITYSRLLRGPARPSWSFRFELFVATMRALSYELAQRTLDEQRRAMDALGSVVAPIMRKVRRSRADMGGVPCEWFVPRTEGPDPIAAHVVYFHGGGYVFGSATSHAEVIARVALVAPARVLAPEYRLAPEHPFPAAINDAVAAYRALLASGVDPEKVVVSGDSAGGGLAMALLLRLKAAGDPLPAGAALISPWLDLTAAGGSLETNAVFDWGNEKVGHGWIAHYLQGHDPRDPLASPIYADFSGLPPMLLQVGDAEIIFDQSVALAKRAKDDGVDVRLAIAKDMVHDWHSFAGVFPELTRAYDEIGGFVREVTNT